MLTAFIRARFQSFSEAGRLRRHRSEKSSAMTRDGFPLLPHTNTNTTKGCQLMTMCEYDL